MKQYDTTPEEAAKEVAKKLTEAGFEVKNIKNMEADIAWLREQGLV